MRLQRAGFACGLIFLNVIFICIIAFNKNIVYVGDGYNSNNNYARAQRALQED